MYPLPRLLAVLCLHCRLCFGQDVEDTLTLCRKMFRIPAFATKINYYFSKEFEATGNSRFSRGLIKCTSSRHGSCAQTQYGRY